MNLAPIVLFVYNRPWHTKQTVEALQKNELARDSELFIYSDAPKTEQTEAKVKEVRDYIHSIDGFKEITVIVREKNWGLAASIIDGVTRIVNQYGKIIVLEDDLVTSPYFLHFMNDSLRHYENESKVMHVSGWNYPIDQYGLNDMFFWRVMNCWGWATWANRWQYYEKDAGKVISHYNPEMIKKFDLDNSGIFWSQVVGNQQGKLTTWAIFWYASIFSNSGLCLNPTQSYVTNIGHDATGVHCGNTGDQNFPPVNMKPTLRFEKDIIESLLAVERIKTYFRKLKKPLWISVINKVSRNIMGRNLIK